MTKPDRMRDGEWNAFVTFMRTQNMDVTTDHPDDVQPWLAVWRAAIDWMYAEVIP